MSIKTSTSFINTLRNISCVLLSASLLSVALFLHTATATAGDLNSILQEDPDMTWNDVQTAASQIAAGDEGALGHGSVHENETETFEGSYTPNADVRLAIFSDDGCNVAINGQSVWSAENQGQSLANLSQSLHIVGNTLYAGQTYQIKVDYSNTVYKGNLDVDGVTLFAFGAGTVNVSSMSIQRVNFSGDAILQEDTYPAISNLYGTPKWDISREPTAFPIRYRVGSTPMSNAAFNVVPSTADKAVYIRGHISGHSPNVYFPARRCSPSGGFVSYPSTSANYQFSSSISHTNFAVEWEFSTDNQQTWQSAGASSNPLYKTIQISAAQLTVVHISCVAASGQSQPTPVFDAIWQQFRGLGITNFKGQPMKYWGAVPPIEEIYSDAAGLVLYANGTCGPWADFFMATNSIQGVTLERVRITGRPKMISIPANAAPEYCPVYEFQVPANTPGQNMSPPTNNSFADHVFTKRNGVIYDPSYGVKKHTQQEWEDSQITSITFRNPNSGLKRTIPKSVGAKEFDYS